MKKLIILLVVILCGCQSKQSETFAKTELIFTTPVTITIYEGGSQEILNESFNLLRELDLKFSKTNEQSELYKLNQSGGQPFEVSDELLEVVSTSIEYSKLTGGLFDITIYPLALEWGFSSESASVPTNDEINNALASVNYENIEISENFITLNNGAKIDLGGIAKGYIGEKVEEYLREQGITRAIIDIGGNIVTIGRKNDDMSFTIGIKKPYSQTNEVIHSIEAEDKSIVSSGSYERFFEVDGIKYHHILNPKTGYPAESDLLSVTIISSDATIADALSTACFVMGFDDAKAMIEELLDVEAVFITHDYEVYEIN